MNAKLFCCLAILVLVVTWVNVAGLHAASFQDTFEDDAVGSFPSKWTSFHQNADVVVIDETAGLGTVYAGDRSLRMTFNGGYGSGIKTTFDPITEGVVSFQARVDSLSDDLQLMGIFNYSDPEAPGSQLQYVSVHTDKANYWVKGKDTGVPIVFGEYVRFDLEFDVVSSTINLLINGQSTNIVDTPLQNSSIGVTTLRSNHETDVGGSAVWYLDDVTVVPVLIGPYAISVVAYDNTDATSPFTTPSEALGAPDAASGAPQPYGVVSLGRLGSISLQLGEAVMDVSGPDLVVWEELTYQSDGVPDETADVFLSFNATDWTLVGQVERGDRDSLFIDINGTGMSGATYVKIVDVSGNGTPSGARGFDLDAVTIIPEPAMLSLLAVGGLALLRRRRNV